MGIPFVTADTFKQSAMTQCEVIMNYYDEKIYQLYREFSLSTSIVNVSKQVREMARQSKDNSIYREKSSTVVPCLIFNQKSKQQNLSD